MPEIFKPRENMKYNKKLKQWECRDERGKIVCDGGPSLIWDEGHQWLFWTRLIGYHRLDGPATSEGRWYINTVNVTKEIQQFAQENNIDLENLTDEDKVLIALKFG